MTAVTDRKYGSITNAQTQSATSAAALTPSDSADITGGQARGLYVGGAGDVAVKVGEDTTAVTFTAVPNGTVLPVLVTRLMDTDTTATDIVALY